MSKFLLLESQQISHECTIGDSKIGFHPNILPQDSGNSLSDAYLSIVNNKSIIPPSGT